MGQDIASVGIYLATMLVAKVPFVTPMCMRAEYFRLALVSVGRSSVEGISLLCSGVNIGILKRIHLSPM